MSEIPTATCKFCGAQVPLNQPYSRGVVATHTSFGASRKRRFFRPRLISSPARMALPITAPRRAGIR
jgi:hypothetical protein